MITLESRLLLLHLRSRRAGWIVVAVLAVTAVRRIVVPWTAGTGPFDMLVSLLLVGAAASMIATGLASPFGDTERSAGGRLPTLRGAQLLGTALLAAAGFTVAAATGGLPVTDYLRDTAGFLGIALLTGAVLGAQRCWSLPVAFAVVCSGEVDLHEYPAWAWPILPAGDLAATGIAVTLLVLGATVVTVAGLPDR